MPPQVRGRKSQAIPQAEEDGDVDRYGVHSLTRVEMVPSDRFPALLRTTGSAHPRFTGMAVARIQWRLVEAGTFFRVTYIYEGFIGSLPEPVYELTGAVSEEPIQTHKGFAEIAGTPSAPLNGAVFIDPDTGRITKDNARGVFFEFAARAGDEANDMAGVSSYVAPSLMWAELTYTTTRPSDVGDLGTIDSPAGPNPTGGAGTNWMFWGTTYRKRGGIYERRREWKLSGRNGWNQKVYDT